MRVSVPVYRVGRVNIGTHVWFVYLRPCTTTLIRRLCDCQSLHAHEFSIMRMSLFWVYQRAPPDQRVTSEDSDLASLVNTGWSESEPVVHWLFLKTLYHSDGQYSIVKSISKQKKLCWLIFHNTILGRFLSYKAMTWDDVERCVSNPTRHARDFIITDFRHCLCCL